MAAHGLKNQAKLGDQVRMCTLSSFPKDVLALVDAIIDVQSKKVLSQAAITKNRFMFDCAYAVFMRDVLVPGEKTEWLYLWLDSSPQGKTNWLMSRLLQISVEDQHLHCMFEAQHVTKQ